MKSKISYWLRWIAVLPGAITISFLSTLPLHWILYIAFAKNGTFLGFIELPDGINTSIEYYVYPLVIAFVFIYSGYKIAPKHKFKTAIILFGIYLIIWLFVSVIALSGSGPNNLDMQFSGRTMLAFFGAIIGLLEARREAKKA